jgi:O-antigen ligase
MNNKITILSRINILSMPYLIMISFCLFLSILAAILISYDNFTLLLILIGILCAPIVVKNYFLGLLVFVFLIPFEAGFLTVGGAGFLSYTRILGLLVFAGWLIKTLVISRLKLITTLMPLLILLIIWAAISLSWAMNVNAATTRLLSILQLVGLFLILINEVNTQERFWKVLFAFSISCYILCFLGILRAINLPGGTLLTLAEGQGPKGYSYFVGIGLLFSVVLFILGPRKYKIFAALGFFLSLFPLFAIGQRGSPFALALAFFSILFVARKRRARILIFGILFVILIIVGFYAVTNLGWIDVFIVDRWSVESVVETRGSSRLDIWEAGFEIFLQNTVFGVGLNNFPYAHALHAGRFKGSHNDLLLILVELGLVGFIIYSVFITKATIKLIHVFLRNLRAQEYLLLTLVLGFLIFTIAIGLTSDLVWRKATWLIYGLAATMPSIITKETAVAIIEIDKEIKSPKYE